MTKTYASPKEALIADGKIPTKLGRGRMSLAQKERIGELITLGWKINGYSVSNTPISAVADKTVNVTKVTRTPASVSEDTPFYFSDEYRFPEAEYVAKDDKGNIYKMREACNTCGYSLCGHICESPSVYGIPVSIVKVKA